MKQRKLYKGDIPFTPTGNMETFFIETGHKINLSHVRRTHAGTEYIQQSGIKFLSPFSEEQLQLEEGEFKLHGRKYEARIAPTVLVPNFEFRTVLEFSNYWKGRSSVQMLFKCPEGRQYSMFISDFCETVPRLKEGKLSGNFTFSKKGANYGVVWIGE